MACAVPYAQITGLRPLEEQSRGEQGRKCQGDGCNTELFSCNSKVGNLRGSSQEVHSHFKSIREIQPDPISVVELQSGLFTY